MVERFQLETYLKLVFGNNEGYICIAVMQPNKRGMNEHFFIWPKQIPELVETVQMYTPTHNVYYCPQLLDGPKRTKDHVKLCTAAWADLDTCPPDRLLVEPTITVISSPNKYQSVWCFAEGVTPALAEDLSKRIAYYHAPHGADLSGWDLTQLLRVPGTLNFKYKEPQQVMISEANRNRYRIDDFKAYPEVKGSHVLQLPMPTQEAMPNRDPVELLQDYRRKINPNTFYIYDQEPTEDWSKALWKLLMQCFEAGMSREEVFQIALSAKCNKYERDGKPIEFLWKDICRAYLRNEENTSSIVASSEQDDLLSDEEIRDAERNYTFVEDYIEWATGLGDAAVQYHQAGAFIILSTLLAGRVVLPTSFGTVLPNLWFMLLADTTLTRKTTAMDIAMDLVTEIDEDAIMATDGSIEGLMTSLQGRPGRPSVFLRDEFSGLLEMIMKKDYYAGMAETLTKLYDGKMQKRVLRKEIIQISNPVLILFAGGIRNKVQAMLTHEHVSSGFIPRFVFVTAESNISRVEPLGPPTDREIAGRARMLTAMGDMLDHYNVPIELSRGSVNIKQQFKRFNAYLNPGAWARYNKFEAEMLSAGLRSQQADLMTPLYDRLSKSGLKAAVLIAASGQREERIEVTEGHVIHAINFVRSWRNYANEVVNGIGKTSVERELEVIFQAIMRNPGISRSKLMQNYHLTARSADAIFGTLEQRGQITPSRLGKGSVYYPDIGAS